VRPDSADGVERKRESQQEERVGIHGLTDLTGPP
jgi:hypothetical protein